MLKPNNKQCDSNFHQKYQQIVRSLMYLIISLHSDIGFSIVRLAQQMANYNKLSNESVVAYSDLDWA